MDVFMMLLAGFGFLMTFLKRYGMSALGFTMIVTVVVTQFAIIVFGFARLDEAEKVVEPPHCLGYFFVSMSCV